MWFCWNIGTNKNFYQRIVSYPAHYTFKIQVNHIIINQGNIELKKDDEKTFSDIGIRNNFTIKLLK